MSRKSTKLLFTPIALVAAMGIASTTAANEQVQVPGLNMPVAASQVQAPATQPMATPKAPAQQAPKTEVERKPRIVQVTPGSGDIPPVPASVVSRQQQAPAVPVETRQDVIVSSGTNTLIPISKGQINRLVTPFEDPQIQTVSDAEISTSGNVIYVTTSAPQPVTMFVTPSDDESVAISLTLFPQDIPPIQANLIFAQSVPGGQVTTSGSALAATASSAYSGQAKKWERGQPYMETIRELMRELALGRLPKGYSFGKLISGAGIPACAQPSLSFDFSKSQLILGHDFRVYVAVAENVSSQTVEFDHGACTHPHRAAITSWPNEILEPGQKTEVFIVTRVPIEVPDSSSRPSLL
ncbi:type-F conjugative transfer system secretin TraK [Aquipseudomonas alcaligenes]|uniref:Conjugal transfer pilus assembly protein TraK n=1 Tax=Aquipseudomonas alcaligenes TaxID=43263 RepID=A0A1N6XEE3_AQUAC|nr:type-F conjugative transfer system secretin TraK [Pseudomonas alcaligenes]SIR00609.1 conjugal transfer pilus assembly protein TraK [Pseudomonas alcaligenes]